MNDRLFPTSAPDHAENGEDDELPHTRRILDPVHDYIEFEPQVYVFIDTPEFQRLRCLKQLGVSYYVFPGGSHNRFEHCLGVAHLARRMVDNLRRKQPKLGINDRDVFCVQVAGLCHDLGHGPFSHVWDGSFIPMATNGKYSWTHEEGSEMMFDHLIANNPHIEISQDCVNFIKDLIRGQPSLTLTHDPPEKPFLFQIVANKINGIDVDKFDYIERDTKNCGDKCSVVTSRLLDSCRVIGNIIAYDYKDYFNIAELFHTRYSLHKRLYQHKTAKSIEHMVVDALLAADPILHLADKTRRAEDYLYLTDSVLEDIERSTDPGLAKARAIIRRFRVRDLYKLADLKVLPVAYVAGWKNLLTEKTIANEAANICQDGALTLNAEDLIVDWSVLHMGMKESHPINLVKFYGKDKPNECLPARPYEGSQLLPDVSQELQLYLFTRDASKRYLAQMAFRSLVQRLPDVSPDPAPQSQSLTPSTPQLPSAALPSPIFVSSSAPSTPIAPSGASAPGSPLTLPKNPRDAREPNSFLTLSGTKRTMRRVPSIPSNQSLRPTSGLGASQTMRSSSVGIKRTRDDLDAEDSPQGGGALDLNMSPIGPDKQRVKRQ